MWASSADMSNSWSKMELSRITYCDHVGLPCGHKQFMVQMVLSRITYFNHVGF